MGILGHEAVKIRELQSNHHAQQDSAGKKIAHDKTLQVDGKVLIKSQTEGTPIPASGTLSALHTQF